MKVSILIPVYNEALTIDEVLKRVFSARLPANWTREVIVVNDGSTDTTQTRLLKYLPKIKLIAHTQNSGKGAAIISAIKAATGSVVLIQDADLEYDPGYYFDLLQPFTQSPVQAVYGSRLLTMKFSLWGSNKTVFPLHFMVNKSLSFFTRLLYSCKLTDIETGYKVIDRILLTNLNLQSRDFAIETEITAKLLRSGVQISEVPITTVPRNYAEGKKIQAIDALIALVSLIRWRVVKIT